MPNGLKKVIISLLFLLSFTGSLIGLQNNGQADQVKQNVSLKVEPQTKDLKFQNHDSSFFDFNLAKDDNLDQEITIKVTNTSKDKAVRFITQINQATTSKDGVMVYDGKGKLVKNIFNFKDMVKFKDNNSRDVVLQPGESRDLHFQVTTPNNQKFSNFNGTIIGGVYLLEQPNKYEKLNTKISRCAYPVAIRINKGQASPNIAMKQVKPDTLTNHNMVDAMITNNHPVIVSQMNYSATVVKKGTNDVVAKGNLSNGQIGPNNQFKLEVPWLTKRLVPGAYTMKVKISSTDPQLGAKGGTWFLEKDFTVSVIDAIILNAKITHSIPWLFILVVVVILSLIYGLVYWLVQLRKRREGLE